MLRTTQAQMLVSYIGVLVQLLGSVLLVVFFFLLRRSMSRKAYFGMWAWAWLFLTLGLVVIVLRYRVVPDFDVTESSDAMPQVQLIYMLYQFCKLIYLECLVAGTVMFAKGLRTRRYFAISATLALGVAVTSVLVGESLAALIVWQAPLAVGAFSYCAVLILRLPPSRRTLGSEVTGTVFGLAGVLWILYAGAFGLLLIGHALTGPLNDVVHFNSYVDGLLQLLLAFGMVVMLMEDAKREVDDAHAEIDVAHSEGRREALVDPLTGAMNRRAFTEGLGLESAKAAYGAVVMLDLDNLKQTNDNWGHTAGDVLLRSMAAVLHAAVRPSDRVYRWGGDEFLVVLPGAGVGDAEFRLAQAISASPGLNLPGAPEPQPLLVSLGGARYRGAEEMAAAIDEADQVMYRQKARRKALRAGQQAAMA